ncbi:TMUB2 isoform 10 [Pongo abelii]|uniref:TMUB2 isoform 10 n=1 Tax=Pongo abelii TaxID=9601 RepID=A0A2J8UYD4_PONAB|nr:TMUB2 isoform 10 [Pongo abelii]
MEFSDVTLIEGVGNEQILPWTRKPDETDLPGPPATGPSPHTAFSEHYRQLCDSLPPLTPRVSCSRLLSLLGPLGH